MSMCTVLFPHIQLSLMFYFLELLRPFILTFIAGGHRRPIELCPTKALYGVLRISRLITWTYLHQFCNSFDVIFLKWRPAKPRTGMSIFPHFETKLLPSDFHLMSLHWLYGFRNLSCIGDGNCSVPSRVVSLTHSCQV